MTKNDATQICPCCGYARPSPTCGVCGGKGVRIFKRSDVHVGRGNPVLDVLLGLDDVRRAIFALLFEREYIGLLRWPVTMNLIACAVLVAIGIYGLLPAYEEWFATEHASSRYEGPHLWLVATGMCVAPMALDLLAGWAQDPIRRATEHHMIGATLTKTPRTGPTVLERMQMLLLAGIATPMAMALVLIPYVGLPGMVVVGAVIAAIVWLQQPAAVRGVALRLRLQVLIDNKWRAFGTGLGLQLAAGVPFVNILALSSVATIAATSAWLHFDKSSLGAPPQPDEPSGPAAAAPVQGEPDA